MACVIIMSHRNVRNARQHKFHSVECNFEMAVVGYSIPTSLNAKLINSTPSPPSLNSKLIKILLRPTVMGVGALHQCVLSG